MIRKTTRLEQVLYAAAFLLALFVRLASLSHPPLTNSEAGLALQALAIARGQAAALDPQPAYLALTAALMFLFDPLNGLARFWPALAGSLLALAPALWKDRLGRLPALLLAFFLALDPGLLAVSRQADGRSLAITFTLFALLFWRARRPALAGISAGLAVLSGPSFWPGAAGLGIALLLAGQSLVDWQAMPVQAPFNWRAAAGFALGTIFFTGTLFFTIPGGLGAAAGGLAAYLSGWTGQGAALRLVLLGLLSYAFFPLLFGVWGAIRGLLRRDPVDLFLAAWFVAAFILSLAYPSRQVADLAWVVIPLWALAARLVAVLVTVPSYERAPALGQAILALFILGFASLTIISLVNFSAAGKEQQYWIRLAGAVIMLVAGAGLIAWGWSRTVAGSGLVWAAAVLLLVYTLAVSWNAAGLSSRPAIDIWSGSRGTQETGLLQQTLNDLTVWGVRTPGGPDLVVVGPAAPALRWALRDYSPVSYLAQVPQDASPALVITPEQPDLAIAATYRGQAFTIVETPVWSFSSPAAWLRWLVFRTLPDNQVQAERVVLWARTDLFPGGVMEEIQQPENPDPEELIQPR